MKKCYICGKDIDGGVVVDKECVDKLIAENKRLKALETDSGWVKLPCKVGDILWLIKSPIGAYLKVPLSIRFAEILIDLKSPTVGSRYLNRIGDIGKKLFLTQAEAEAKLAELKGAVK